MSGQKIPRLEVRWYDGRLVGHVFDTGVTYFAYADEWVANGHSLAPAVVPFTTEAVRQRDADFDHLPGFLADCLPDQWGRRIMQQAFAKLDDHNPSPMRQLAWVGRRGIGALAFQPTFASDGASGSWKNAESVRLMREAEAVLCSAPAEAFPVLVGGGTAGGAYPKATVALLPDGSMLHGGDVAQALREHPNALLGILKLDCDWPLAAGTPPPDSRMEHAYLLMGQAAGMRCAASRLLLDQVAGKTRHHLFVERFDVEAGTGRRRHLVTLAGMAHTFKLNYVQLLGLTQTLTGDRREVCEVVRRMLFNLRSGNADDHGKNHSFMYDEDSRKWTLSPAYDLTLSYARGKSYPGMFMATFGDEPRLPAVEKVAVQAGLTAAEFAAIDQQVRQACARLPEFADQARVDSAALERALEVHGGLARNLDAAPLLREPLSRRRRWKAFD